MATTDLLCCICKSVVIGQRHDALFASKPEVDRSLACEGCGKIWRRFRVDINARKEADAALALDQLTLRGAVAADLHAKIAATDETEAAKLDAMVSLREVIRGIR